MRARLLAQRNGQIMSREKAADGQTNEADFTTKGSKLDLKYQCKCLICFMFQALEELYGHIKQTRDSQLYYLNCIKHYFSKSMQTI